MSPPTSGASPAWARLFLCWRPWRLPWGPPYFLVTVRPLIQHLVAELFCCSFLKELYIDSVSVDGGICYYSHNVASARLKLKRRSRLSLFRCVAGHTYRAMVADSATANAEIFVKVPNLFSA